MDSDALEPKDVRLTQENPYLSFERIMTTKK